MSELSIADERFCAYVANGFSATEAYKKANPKSKATDKSINEIASRKMDSVKINSRIDELKVKVIGKIESNLEVTVERVLKERARLAFFSAKNLLHGDGTPKAIHELDDDTAAAITGFDVVSIASDGDQIGQINKIKMADKNASLTALEKHLNMYKENDQSNGVLNININLG